MVFYSSKNPRQYICPGYCGSNADLPPALPLSRTYVFVSGSQDPRHSPPSRDPPPCHNLALSPVQTALPSHPEYHQHGGDVIRRRFPQSSTKPPTPSLGITLSPLRSSETVSLLVFHSSVPFSLPLNSYPLVGNTYADSLARFRRYGGIAPDDQSLLNIDRVHVLGSQASPSLFYCNPAEDDCLNTCTKF